MKSKALLGDEIVKFNGNMNIAKGELVKITNDLEIKTGLFRKATFEKGTELKVIDAYIVKDKPVMKARIRNEEYEIPFSKLNLEYSDKYFNEFKEQSKARFDSRHKTEVYTEFREQLLKQKANAPKDNLNAPNQRIKNPNTPNRNTPKY